MASKNEIAICGLPLWVFIIPPTILILAPVFKWPDGYYQITRLAVCCTSAAAAFYEYKHNRKNLAAVATFIALIFNPLFIVDFSRAIWAFIDWAVAGLWIFYLWKAGVGLGRMAAIFAFPTLILSTVPTMTALDKYSTRVWHETVKRLEGEYLKLISFERFEVKKKGRAYELTGTLKNNTNCKIANVSLMITFSRGISFDKDTIEETYLPNVLPVSKLNPFGSGMSLQFSRDIYIPEEAKDVLIEIHDVVLGESFTRVEMTNILATLNKSTTERSLLYDIEENKTYFLEKI